MTKTQEAKCSEGWGERCSHAKIPKCNCDCHGQNHGAKYRAKLKKFEEYMQPGTVDTGFIAGDVEDREVYINGNTLDPEFSQSIRNHSPDGFAWGYGGSGPAQLALAILLAVSGDKEYAQAFYQQFKWDIISGLDKDKDFRLPVKDVKAWIKEHSF